MKKIFVFLLLIQSQTVFSHELWDGITTEMSKNQAINKATNILNVNSYTYQGYTNQIYMPFGKDYYNYLFPSKIIYEIQFSSPLEQYFRGRGNYCLFFYGEDILAISIQYLTNIRIIGDYLIKNYGNYSDVYGVYKKVYKWETQEKIIYLRESWNGPRFNEMIIVSKDTLNKINTPFR